jgi:signal transduction histidine kinase
MRPASLSARILAVAGLVLLVFCGASIGILYRAQTQLANQAMDSLLKNDAFALSSLINSHPGGRLEFEITPLALSDYQSGDSGEFFRFIDPKSGQVFKESIGAPKIDCPLKVAGNLVGEIDTPAPYRIRSSFFQPETDTDEVRNLPFDRSWICLVVGVSRVPYKNLVVQSLISTVPIQIFFILIAIAALLILVRKLTADLSHLTRALKTTDFAATHEFPKLPEAHTLEVQAVVEKLADLHHQAATVYQEMWLFLGRAAHQLKTPVAAISSTLQVLVRKDRTKEELLIGLSDLQTGVDLLSTLSKKLIDSSRVPLKTPAILEPVDLESFFVTQLKVYRARAEQGGVEIHLTLSNPVSVKGSLSLLAEIFGNLIENAILYSGGKGPIEIAWRKDQNFVWITVSDRGPGFPASVKANLFRPFVRGDERTIPGSGLGLSSAFKATTLLGGNLKLTHSTLNGSTLTASLPLI